MFFLQTSSPLCCYCIGKPEYASNRDDCNLWFFCRTTGSLNTATSTSKVYAVVAATAAR